MKRLLFCLMAILMVTFVAAEFEINPSALSFSDINYSNKITETVEITNTGAEKITLNFPSEFLLNNGMNYTAGLAVLPANLSLDAGQSRSYTFEITLTKMLAEEYSGAINITDSTSFQVIQDIELEILPMPQYELPEFIDFGVVLNNKSAEKTFKIRNTGNTDINNIKLSSNAESKYKVIFTPNNLSILHPEEEKEIKAKVYIPLGTDAQDNLIIGNIKVDTDELDTIKAEFLKVNVKSFLFLEKVRVEINGKTQNIEKTETTIDEGVEPTGTVDIDVIVENLWYEEAKEEIDINDVEVELNVFDIRKDDEDIEIKSDSFDLNYEGNDRTHTFELDFDVPREAEDGTYDMEIKVTGTDEDDREFTVTWNLELKVEREKYNLVIIEYKLNPDAISCSLSTVADFEIMNLGKDDEDYMRYTLKNDALGINYEESRLEISSDPEEEENIFRESIPININSANPGKYTVELRVYRDFDVLEDVSGINLNIGECSKATPEPPKPEPEAGETEEESEEGAKESKQESEEKPEEAEEIIFPKQKPGVEVADSPTIIGVPIITGVSNFRQSKSYTFFLILANVAGILLVIVLVLMFVKLRKH